MSDKLISCRPLVLNWATLGLLAIGAAGTAVAQPDSSSTPPAVSDPAAALDHEPAPAGAAETGPATRPERNERESTIPSLDQMLATAFDHNPDVAYAAAALKVAQAQLDRTRLDVAQKVIEFRQRWQTQRTAVIAAEQELRNAYEMRELAKARGNVPPREVAGLEGARQAAQRKLAVEREKLTDLQAELPFLLGRPLPATDEPAAREPKETAERSELLRDTLRPLLKKLIDAAQAEHNVGRGPAEQIYEASRRLMYVERSLATTRAERIAAVETHRDRMKRLRDEIAARHKVGAEANSAVLAAEVYVAEADLVLLEERATD